MDSNIELVDGVEMYRIPDSGDMDPFLMTIVSSSDLWMYVSSTGGLTAGRVDRDHCVFPYETDDRLHAGRQSVGPVTVLRVHTTAGTALWAPFGGPPSGTRRSLLKSLLGDAIVFDEEHLELGLRFRYRWAPSERFGWVRTASLHNANAGSNVTIDILDGLAGIMPWGIDAALQQQMSNLASAYRRSEIVDPGIGIFSLETSIVDRPEPAEALRATTVWSSGFDEPVISVDPAAVDHARLGGPIQSVTLRTGRPGSFLVGAAVTLAAGRTHRWHLVADVAQSQADIASLRSVLASTDNASALLDADISRSSSRLRDLIAGADGVQLTASATNDAHHLANTLFNVMRGGTFVGGDAIDADRFRAFVRARNVEAAERHADWLARLPSSIGVDALRSRAAELPDPNVARLALEYLPLAFSRRHGDPSRPWNHFAIRVRDAAGDPLLAYQGNWRDIFQNWEALCRSFPAFLPSIIAKFVNASTADGHNPYRITSDGVDWEVPEPGNPWSGIGYWGDHQIVYLYRLLQAQQAHRPGWLAGELGRRIYAFTDVPYRIVPFDRLLRNPKATIEFDLDTQARVDERVGRLGADGVLLPSADGDVRHVTLIEKLLIPALAKLSNFVPRGGIWMNTQRPEWNDANNALVGHGLSMVTLAHLRRYLRLLEEVTADVTQAFPVSSAVVTWMGAVTAVLESHDVLVDAPLVDAADRARVLCGLGVAYGDYRVQLYEAGLSATAALTPDDLRRLLGAARRHLDDAIRAARRPDGLYESYNLLGLSDDAGCAVVTHLPVMLEGQVAAISSGLLAPEEVSALVRTMFESELYRPDVDSFVLYPPRQRPPFMERNQVPSDAVESNPLLSALLEAGSTDVIVVDVEGTYRFNADFRNADDLIAALDRITAPHLASLVVEHRAQTMELFERVFGHHEFTGRSSTMYAYEGIGSVYWHMVAKLLLAVQECILDAPTGTAETSLADLIDLYGRIRGGLGFNKTAQAYGAFPTDPYSHTPAHAGAQQPGMTGQVKEELLTRWAELGLTVRHGSLCFTPRLLSEDEIRPVPGDLVHLDVAGRTQRAPVPAGAAAFTTCQVPVVVHATEATAALVVRNDDGSEREISGTMLDQQTSQDVFGRTGAVTRIDVHLPRSWFGRGDRRMADAAGP